MFESCRGRFSDQNRCTRRGPRGVGAGRAVQPASQAASDHQFNACDGNGTASGAVRRLSAVAGARLGDRLVSVLAIGRDATLVGWGVIAVALGAVVVVALLS